MGSSHSVNDEYNLCKEISWEDMAMLRIELTTNKPERALKLLGLQPYNMPYVKEEVQNSSGEWWTSYHDLVGEIDQSLPAEVIWR